MSSKRSRVVRSSSLGEIGLFNQIQPIEVHWEKKRAAPVNVAKPVKKLVKKPAVAMRERSGRSILTLGSPIREEGSVKNVDEGFGVFFQACFTCKKKIAQEDDVFMYGYLRAFCSPECRDKQISLDEKQNKTSSETTEVAENLMQKDLGRRGFGIQFPKYTVAKFK